MQALVDFLNHGVLPFTGREQEKERLTAFWRSTTDVQWMRLALLVGEAGIGKSRLIEEISPSIIEAGGMVVHTKLYQESATSLAPLLAQALWYADGAKRLLKNEPDSTLPAVLAGLRRISRLRPTLLVIEDLHLLSGEALPEFTQLLDALADEILSVLCAARPVELEARGAIERYLTDEIELSGLPPEDVRRLWRRVFDAESIPEILGPLLETTHGNPLALRSALRGSLRSESLARDEGTGQWHLTIPGAAYNRTLQRSVGFLAEGMAAHLTGEEKAAAERLAALGEVFARESARAILDDADRLLDRLTFKGMIGSGRTRSQPIDDAVSHYPLFAFTHTLLHQHFAESGAEEEEGLLRVLADRYPLYSILPLQRIARRPGPYDVPIDVLRGAILRTIDASARLDRGPDWKLAVDVWTIADGLLADSAERWTSEEFAELRARLLIRKLGLYRRRDQSDEYQTMIDSLLDLTRSMNAAGAQRHYLSGLRYLHWRSFRRDYERCGSIWSEVQNMLAADPSLLTTGEYTDYLYDVAHTAAAMADPLMLRRVEQQLFAILESETIDDEAREAARLKIIPHLLPLFESPEELASRFAMVEELGRTTVRDTPDFKVWKITLLESTGRMEAALASCNDLLQHAQHLALPQYAFQSSLVRLCAYAAFGMELDEILTRARALCDDAPEANRQTWRTNAGIYLTTVGLLRGEEAWCEAVATEFLGGSDQLWPEKRALLALAADGIESLLPTLPSGDTIADTLRPLVQIVAGLKTDAELAIDGARRALESPLLRLEDLLQLSAVLALLDRTAETVPEVNAALTESARRALTGALAWLEERSLAAYMRTLLRRYERRLTKREGEAWRARAAAIEREKDGTRLWRQGSDRLAVSMLGTISIAQPGAEPERLRGPRLCTVLGLLVANRMLDEPLDHPEFCRLAAGEIDPDLARKTTNQAIVRLRDALSPDAIVTGEETHELNLDLVEVDLLEVHARLNETELADRDRALMRAVPALLKALELSAGEVPFPGLYDDFFEAIRSDFENRMRNAVLSVAAGLLREGDAFTAERVLRLAFESMPDDEEVSDLLCDALVASDKRTEAERVRMRSEASRRE